MSDLEKELIQQVNENLSKSIFAQRELFLMSGKEIDCTILETMLSLKELCSNRACNHLLVTNFTEKEEEYGRNTA